MARRSARLRWGYFATAVMGVVGLVGLGLAVRRLRRTSDSLRQSEEHVRAVIATALDAVVTMESGGLITDWNPRAEAMFGWTRQEAVGRAMSETIIPHRYRDAHDRGIRHFLDSAQGPVLNQRIEISALRRDGTEFPIELAVIPLKVGSAFTFSGFIRDISVRKNAET